MNYTENFKLKKPESADFYNVEDFNENVDIIDEKIQKHSEEIRLLNETTDVKDLAYSGHTYNENTGAINSTQHTAFSKVINVLANLRASIDVLVLGHNVVANNLSSHSEHLASDEEAGHVIISSDTYLDYTHRGCVLHTAEKNPDIYGTLAYQITTVSNKLNNLFTDGLDGTSGTVSVEGGTSLVTLFSSTCEESGLYKLIASINTNELKGKDYAFAITVNNQVIYRVHGVSPTTYHLFLNIPVIQHLNAGDVVALSFCHTADTPADVNFTFDCMF